MDGPDYLRCDYSYSYCNKNDDIHSLNSFIFIISMLDTRNFFNYISPRIKYPPKINKNIWEHVFHRRRTLTLSLKVFDSALERRCSQLHMCVFVRSQVLRNIICSMLKHVILSHFFDFLACLMYDNNCFQSFQHQKKTHMCS